MLTFIYADIYGDINYTSIIWAFNHIENKHSLCHDEDCMKIFCRCLREHAKNVINFEKKKMLLLTKKRVKITTGCKSMLHLWKKIHKKAW